MGIKSRIVLAILILLEAAAVAVVYDRQQTSINSSSDFIYVTPGVMEAYPTVETSVYEDAYPVFEPPVYEAYPYPPLYKVHTPTVDPNMTPAPKIFIPTLAPEPTLP